MSFDIIYQIVFLLVGLGTIIFGAKIISGSAQNMLSKRLQLSLAKNSNSNFKNMLFGLGTTTFFQTSAISNVLTLSFLGVGKIGLSQAMAITVGAGIGSATAMVILMLQSVSVLKFFCLFVLVGAFVLLFFKQKKAENIAMFLIGFGLLCLGITLISMNFSQILQENNFSDFFAVLNNPFVFMLIGLVLCILAQSAYPVMVMLIPLVGDNLISFDLACFAILGMNIGTTLNYAVCVESVATGKNGQKLLAFNVILKVLICIVGGLLMLIPGWTNFVFADVCAKIPSISLVLIFILFNLLSLLVLPFLQKIAKLLDKMFQTKNESSKSFEVDDSKIKNAFLANEAIKQKSLSIFEKEIQIFQETKDKIFTKKRPQYVLKEQKYVERMIKITTNSAIRFGGMFGKAELEKMNIFVDILNNEKQILKINAELLRLFESIKQEKNLLSGSDKKRLNNLCCDILELQKIVFEIFKQPKKEANKTRLNLVFTIHEQNEQNFSDLKKEIIKNKVRSLKTAPLLFAIIYQLDEFENELFDMSVKITLMEE